LHYARAKHIFFIFPYRSAGALYLLGYGYSSFSLTPHTPHPNAGFGKELIAKGFESEVELASALNISNSVPLFTENAYVRQIVK